MQLDVESSSEEDNSNIPFLDFWPEGNFYNIRSAVTCMDMDRQFMLLFIHLLEIVVSSLVLYQQILFFSDKLYLWHVFSVLLFGCR